jgi:hypothetical protein
MKKAQSENFIYDRTLKELLQGIPKRFITMLTGQEAVKLLDPTFPKTEERRADYMQKLSFLLLVPYFLIWNVYKHKPSHKKLV